MSKLTKAIKLAQGFTKEEQEEFIEFFKKEEDEQKDGKTEDKKEVKEEVKKEEVKVEVKDDDKEKTDLQKLFESMNEKISTLNDKVEKLTPFGKKQKQTKGKESNEFDDVFNNLNSGRFT